MKKSELHTGDVVTLRDGTKAIVLLGIVAEEYSGDCIVFIYEDGWEKLDSYNEDLTAKPFGLADMRGADIVNVEKCPHPYDFCKMFR